MSIREHHWVDYIIVPTQYYTIRRITHETGTTKTNKGRYNNNKKKYKPAFSRFRGDGENFMPPWLSKFRIYTSYYTRHYILFIICYIGTLHPRADPFNASNGMTERELFVSAKIDYYTFKFNSYCTRVCVCVWNTRRSI